MKKLSLLLAVLCLSLSAMAEIYTGKLGDDITWELDSETGVLDVKGKGLMYSECDPADFGDTKVTKINIGEGIKTVTQAITQLIGYPNFYNVEEVNLPSTLKEIGKDAFFGAVALKSITLPDGLITIGDYAFWDCNKVTEIHFPSSLTSIGYQAFTLLSIKELYIPSTLTQIGAGAFGGCSELESIVVDPENPAYDSRNDCNCIIDTKHRYLISGCENSFIPNGVKTIGKYAFWRVQKSYIEIPSCVQYIDDDAFESTALVDVIFNEGLLEIGRYAFHNTKIDYLYLPGSLRAIGDYAFYVCPEMKEIQLGPGLKTMGPRAITWTQSRKLEKIYVYAKVPPVVENPDPGVNHDTRVYVQRSSLEAYKNDPFWKKYTNYYEMEDLEEHPNGQCGDDLYWEYDTYGSLIIRGLGDMWDYELKPGTLVPATPWYDFRDEIKRVYLPEDLSHIGDYAFLDLSHVEDIYLPSGLNTIGGMAFAGWTFSSVKIPEHVKEIGTLAFSECENLTDVQLSMSLEKIDFGAFMDCKSLKNIEIPTHLPYIGNYAFMNCTALESIKLPASLETLGEMAFYNCSALKSVEMSARGISTLESQTFAHCSSLTYVTLPDDLTKIGSSAFWECTSLRTLGLPQSLAEIDKNAFVDCHSLETLRLPASVQSIGDYAFQRCYKLTHIACDATTPPAMGRYVFDGIGHDVDIEHQAPARRLAPTADGDGETLPANVEKVTIYVPAGSVEAYKAADEWKQFIYFKDLNAYEQYLEESGLGLQDIKGETPAAPAKVIRNGRIYLQMSGRFYHLDGTPAAL